MSGSAGLKPDGVRFEFEVIPPMTEAELDALVRGFSDERLAANYQSAIKRPGTDWARRLSAEIGRREVMCERGGS